MKSFATTPAAEDMRAYRRRLTEKGQHQILADLRCETITFLDEFKQRRGLRSRSQALEQLIAQGRQAIQQ